MPEDGLRIFARSGNVFSSSPVRTEDLLYAGTLSDSSRIQWLNHSTAAEFVSCCPLFELFARSFGHKVAPALGLHLGIVQEALEAAPETGSA